MVFDATDSFRKSNATKGPITEITLARTEISAGLGGLKFQWPGLFRK